jgi:hypothetical protein
MDVPSWVTLSNLGNFSQDYSFDLNPIYLYFSAGTGSVVTLINGSIPAGLEWNVQTQSVKITGVARPSVSDINSRFTFRIRQTNGNISDRTFFLNLTALAIAPSWENQPEFLGYQGNLVPETYQLQAVAPSGQQITYSLVSFPSGMSVSTDSGILVYDANAVTTNSTINFNVAATTSSGSSNKTLTLDVVISPLAPKWYTTAGSLGVFAGNDFFNQQLIAEDVTGAAITYTITSFTAGFPLTLDSDGLLYGRFQNPFSETIFTFTVSATSINGSSSRTFSVTTVPNEQTSLLSWITPSNLGIVDEGQYYQLKIEAITRRNVPLIYNVTGGLLPPHFMIDSTTGIIQGYCEYHAVLKEYNFNITATDGYQSITKQFSLIVNKVYGNQFFGASIPFTGALRQSSVNDVSNIRIRQGGTNIFASVKDISDPAELSVINGIVTGYENPNQIFANANPWLHTLTTQLGAVSYSGNVTLTENVLYRNIVDSQANSNAVVFSSAVFNTNVASNGLVFPISINNIRQSLKLGHNFVTGGSGSGANLYANINWDTGNITNVTVISSGLGYITPPSVTITGSGSGANIRAILGTDAVTISSPGQGWAVNDIITIPGIYQDPALLKVESVGTSGGLASVSIIQKGDYTQVAAIPSLYVQKQNAYAYVSPTWGVIGTEIINGGQGYQCGANLSTAGTEILPAWQSTYFPITILGKIETWAANNAANILNTEENSLYGTLWTPNYIVFNWQGLKWLGQTTFEENFTTFDDDTTRFHEVEDAKITVFDEDLTIFNEGLTKFDAGNPIAYDLQQVWGSTLIDAGTTVFDLYSTIFDALPPRRKSNTLLQKWIKVNNRVYSGNNFVV